MLPCYTGAARGFSHFAFSLLTTLPMATQNKIISLTLNCVILGLYLSPAIACVVIASQYDPDTSPCDQLSPYTVCGLFDMDLPTYLYAAGGMQLAYTILLILWKLGNAWDDDECSEHIGGFIRYLGGCTQLFYWLWSIGGFVIFCNDITEECGEEPVSVMIVVWCALQWGLIPLLCGCLLACAYCAESMAKWTSGIFSKSSLKKPKGATRIATDDRSENDETAGREKIALDFFLLTFFSRKVTVFRSYCEKS